MSFPLLLALLAAQPDGFTREEQSALQATMECQKRFFDSVPRRERRRRGEALIGESHIACAGEEAVLRATLRRRFNEGATEEVIGLTRDTLRGGLLRYIRR